MQQAAHILNNPEFNRYLTAITTDNCTNLCGLQNVLLTQLVDVSASNPRRFSVCQLGRRQAGVLGDWVGYQPFPSIANQPRRREWTLVGPIGDTYHHGRPVVYHLGGFVVAMVLSSG